MKKGIFLFIIFLSLANKSFSQVYTWAAKDSLYSEQGLSLAKDKSGNLFVATLFYRGMNLSKYDRGHHLLWEKQIRAVGIDDFDAGLCTDSHGSIYITSQFGSYLILDSVQLIWQGGGNMFLLKLDSLGNFQWLTHTTGSKAWGMSLSSDAQDNIYVAGRIAGTVCFDTTCFSGAPIYTYVAKYNSNGNLKWVRGLTPGSHPRIKTDPSGNTYITGHFNNSAIFGNDTLKKYGTYGFDDIYLAKIDSSGNWLWARRAGGIYQDNAHNLDLDSSGNIYVIGFFDSPTAAFGTYTLTNLSNDDYFVAKYDSSGNVTWVIRGWKDGYSRAFCVDKQGNSYLRTSSKFIYKYDTNGNYQWSDPKSAGNIAMIADDSGSVYVTGVYIDSIDFGNNWLISDYPGYNQSFVAKLEFPAPTISISEIKKSDALSVYPNPSYSSITICCSLPEEKTGLMLRVLSSLGELVHSESIKNMTGTFTKQLDVGTLPKGIYFVEL
ncbi:MAG: T9SS type A sorting domain-containing protein, partial [Bacteroidia bacterium]